MIRIVRPARLPIPLEARGMRKSEEHCEEYDRDPDSYRHGLKTFDFSKSVYGHVCVRRTLSGAQKDKTGRHVAQGGGALQTERRRAAGIWSTKSVSRVLLAGI